MSRHLKIGDAIAAGNHIPFSATVSDGPAQGFSARGWLGQYLVVLPHLGVVAVRMRKPARSDYGANGVENAERDGSVMYVAPAPNLTAALALVDSRTTSERGLVRTIVATPSCRAEGGERAPQRPGWW